MRSIIGFFREVAWFVNGLYTGVGLTLLVIYILVNQAERAKNKCKKKQK